jgi:hypothetical protein
VTEACHRSSINPPKENGCILKCRPQELTPARVFE